MYLIYNVFFLFFCQIVQNLCLLHLLAWLVTLNVFAEIPLRRVVVNLNMYLIYNVFLAFYL